ncbi:MAG: PepSY domain-containing protein [Filifactor alocis]|nr:PepSY domain-containing protein [Filifactor alocis]
MKTQNNKKNYLGKGLALALGLNLLAGSVIVSAAPVKSIGLEKAKAIALNDARVPASKARFIKTSLDYENGRKVYDIEFYRDNKEYDYEIDAITGRILEKDTDIEGFMISVPASTDVGLEKAKSVALRDAGLSASQVKFVKAHVDFDDGRKVYDIEFYHNNVEYDYEIDAATGKIREKDNDINNFVIPAPASTDVGLEKAKNVALRDAGLSASQVKFVKAHVDFDDGRKVYDIEFYHNNVEYDYEIDAATGKIREKDNDINNFVIPSPASTDVGLEKAKNIALKTAGFSASQVHFTKAKVDFEDGRKVYDIEFYRNNVEYSFEIDASSGKVREYDVDTDDDHYTSAPSNNGQYYDYDDDDHDYDYDDDDYDEDYDD